MIRSELRRLRRGLACMREALGPQFTMVIVAVLLLLVVAVFTIHGAFAGVAALVLALLAIRAHDLGEDQAPEPSEFETFWRDDDAGKAAEREAAARAQVEFLKRRDRVALSGAHEPKEL